MQSGLFDLSCQPLRVPTVFTAERAASLRTQEGNHSSRCLRLWNAPPPSPAEAYWWQLSGAAIVTGSDVHIRKVSHVVSLITQRLRGQEHRWNFWHRLWLRSAFRFVLTGESCGDKRNPNCFLDPQSWWRRRTWIDQEFTQPGKNERKCFDFRFGERMAAFLWVFLDLTSADRCTFSQLPRVNTSIPARLFLANIWFPLSHAHT